MKKEARLQQLIKEMIAGRLSRNKHYDAYQHGEVASARGRRVRMDRLLLMLDRAESEQWNFSLKDSDDKGITLLTCVSSKLNGSWTARLFQFELDMLREHPDAGLLLKRS